MHKHVADGESDGKKSHKFTVSHFLFPLSFDIVMPFAVNCVACGNASKV